MFGCLRRLGCLVVLVVAVAAAYFYRDQWTPWLDRARAAGAVLTGDASAGDAPAAEALPAEAPSDAAATEGVWEPLTPAGADRARAALQSLAGRSGPVFAQVSAGDLASYIFGELANQLPESADSVQAAVRGQRLYLRASVRPADLGGRNVFGPLTAFLGDRETIEFGGNFDIIRPGLAQFRIEEVRLRDLAVPAPAIPRLISQIRRGSVPRGVSDDGLPLQVPSYIGDVRVNRGRVVLYKTVP